MASFTKRFAIGWITAMSLASVVGCAQTGSADADAVDLSPGGRADGVNTTAITLSDRDDIGEALVVCKPADNDCSIGVKARWRSAADPGWNVLTRALNEPGADSIYGSWTTLYPVVRITAVGHGIDAEGNETTIECPAETGYAAVHHEGNRDAGASIVFVAEGTPTDEVDTQDDGERYACAFDDTTLLVNYQVTRIDTETYGLGQLTLDVGTEWL